MIQFLILAILGTVALGAFRIYRNVTKYVEQAKRTGFNYVLLPIPGIGIMWSILNDILIPLLHSLPFTSSWKWIPINDRQDLYRNPRKIHHDHGDSFMTIDHDQLTLKTSNAELISQITTRKTDFVKPVHRYKIIDIFGRSIVTVEGSDWKRHRKVVGPSFSEKSNKLVFEESLRQAMGMMELWASQGDNTTTDIKVANTAVDTAILSLHVICAAGFGLPQLWEGQRKKEDVDDELSNLQSSGNHALTFKEGMHNLLEGITWLVLFPPSLLKISPFKAHKAVYQAYTECKAYFEQLVEFKRKQLYIGEHDDDGTMDLMGPMIRASDDTPSDTKSQAPHIPILSKSELIGNSFIFFFAGHETTANSIHFSMLFLAMHLASQQKMQADIDAIVGREKHYSDFSYHAHMPRLYNSMVGAVLNEELRVMPAVLGIPKETHGDQTLTMDGREIPIPDGTFIQLNVVGANRNPRYWPSAPSKITPGTDDLNDFVPERWLTSKLEVQAEKEKSDENGTEAPDGLEQASFDTTTSGSLFRPIKGSFISFSEGTRACPGRRFAQVEATAVLTAIFQKWSVELDVSEWASDAEIDRMEKEEKRAVYGKAVERARVVIKNCEQATITLQMRKGENVPVRFVERGKERFAGIF